MACMGQGRHWHLQFLLKGLAGLMAVLLGAPAASQAEVQTAGQAAGQGSLTAPSQTVEEALHAMADQAAVIFAGRVAAVRRRGGVVEVVFTVEHPVKGCGSATYVLREWAGLWAGGDVRYRAGQRLFMLLRAPGAGGLSTPVGGMDGAIPIRGVESEISGGLAMAATPVQRVDLRWVAARGVLAGVSAAGSAGVAPTQVHAAWAGRVGANGTGMTSVDLNAGDLSRQGAGSVAAQGASVEAVLEMLGGWEATRAAR